MASEAQRVVYVVEEHDYDSHTLHAIFSRRADAERYVTEANLSPDDINEYPLDDPAKLTCVRRRVYKANVHLLTGEVQLAATTPGYEPHEMVPSDVEGAPQEHNANPPGAEFADAYLHWKSYLSAEHAGELARAHRERVLQDIPLTRLRTSPYSRCVLAIPATVPVEECLRWEGLIASENQNPNAVMDDTVFDIYGDWLEQHGWGVRAARMRAKAQQVRTNNAYLTARAQAPETHTLGGALTPLYGTGSMVRMIRVPNELLDNGGDVLLRAIEEDAQRNIQAAVDRMLSPEEPIA